MTGPSRWLGVTALALPLFGVPAAADDAPGTTTDDLANAAGDPTNEARQALHRLRQEGDRCGLKRSERADTHQPDSFRVVLQASPFQFAFMADAGAWLAPLPGATGFTYAGATITFQDVYTGVSFRPPKGKAEPPTTSAAEYFERLAQLGDAAATLPAHLSRHAEVVLYTVDGNGDGVVDAADRQTSAAASTPRPSDVALHRIVYGTEVTDGQPTSRTDSSVVARSILIWTEPGDEIGGGDKPAPIFTYRLSEPLARFDLNGDGDTDDELRFGDGNGDGQLDAAERDALLASNAGPKTDLVDTLDLDPRFAAAGDADGRPGLLARIRQQFPRFTDEQARQFVHNAIVQVDVELLLEYDLDEGQRRVRRRLQGRAAFRNPLMRLLGLTR